MMRIHSHLLASLFLLPSLVSAGFTVNVCFQVAGEGVRNALVRCYDEDWGTDDRAGNDARTNSNGCVAVYDNQRWFENPDVYCRVYANGECFATKATRVLDDHKSSRNANLGTIALPYDDDYCGAFGANNNGCGPSSFPSWLNKAATKVSGFRTQCAAHDNCYSDCSERRSLCDDDFYNDMVRSCAGGFTCRALAKLFFEAADEFGDSACRNARRGCPSTTLCDR